jgi:hypothetical protein
LCSTETLNFAGMRQLQLFSSDYLAPGFDFVKHANKHYLCPLEIPFDPA